MVKKLQKTKPQKLAIIGFLFSVPFTIGNLIAVRAIEPFYSFLDSFATPLLPMSLLILFLVGSIISVFPIFRDKKFYILNLTVSTLLIITFVLLFPAFAEEFYRCEIISVPNCD